jgi:hypothetical protein
MTDVELTRALERGEIANDNFHHLSHLHVAWVYLSESSSLDEAADKMRATLQRFAASAGRLEKYHETVTLFWMHVLALARAAASGKTLRESFMPTHECWKRIFYSTTIPLDGCLVIKLGYHGLNRT